jgi:hypothetical protein
MVVGRTKCENSIMGSQLSGHSVSLSSLCLGGWIYEVDEVEGVGMVVGKGRS